MTAAAGPHTPVLSQEVFSRWDYLLFALLTTVNYLVIGYVMGAWFALQDWYYHPLSFWSLTLILLGKLSISQFRWWLLPFMRKPLPMMARQGLRVGVVTTFVPGAEPIQMLEETVRALLAMNYPHDTWVLDEGDDVQVKDLCARLGAFHFSRKHFPVYQTEDGIFRARSKHGNYNSWLQEIGFGRYDIIAAFDPDHVPEPFFLSEVLGYFNDAQVGYVQAAQIYYNQRSSFIARGAAEETYTYYSSTQMFCYAMGYPIVTGCHNTHRVSALMEIGGFAPHDADDLLITLFYRSRGWRGVYVPKILARGLTPVDWDRYLKQQLRWARTVLDIKFRIFPKFARKLPCMERVTSFMHGFYYLQGLGTFIIILVLAYMLATGSVPRAVNYVTFRNFFLLVAVSTLCDFYRQRFYLDWWNEWGLPWRAGVLQLAKWPYLLIALYQVILNRRVPYVLTSKVKEQSRPYQLLWPHVVAAAMICVAWMIGIISHDNLHPLVHLFAGALVVGTLLLIATGQIDFPEPYTDILSRSSPSK